MFAQLGDITFEVLGSPESMRITRGWRYPEHPVIDGLPKLQAVGAALDQIELDLRLHASIAPPAAQRDAIYAMADQQVAAPLVFGSGVHRGYFVVTDATEATALTTDSGDPIAIEMHLTLKEWSPGAALNPNAPPKPATAPPAIIQGAAPGATSTRSAAGAGTSALMSLGSAVPSIPATSNPASVPLTTIVRSDS